MPAPAAGLRDGIWVARRVLLRSAQQQQGRELQTETHAAGSSSWAIRCIPGGIIAAATRDATGTGGAGGGGTATPCCWCHTWERTPTVYVPLAHKACLPFGRLTLCVGFCRLQARRTQQRSRRSRGSLGGEGRSCRWACAALSALGPGPGHLPCAPLARITAAGTSSVFCAGPLRCDHSPSHHHLPRPSRARPAPGHHGRRRRRRR